MNSDMQRKGMVKSVYMQRIFKPSVPVPSSEYEWKFAMSLNNLRAINFKQVSTMLLLKQRRVWVWN